jgi:hypothetical protein
MSTLVVIGIPLGVPGKDHEGLVEFDEVSAEI